MSAVTAPNCRFELALSYVGDNKLRMVRRVAELLQAELGPGKVFFDRWFEAELAGPDGRSFIQKFFRTESLLVVPCICKAYNEKPWTRAEWRAIQALEQDLRDAGLHEAARQRILPLRFGEGEVDGLIWSDIVPDVRKRTAKQIAALILDRLKHIKKPSPPANPDDDTEPPGPLGTLIQLVRRRRLVIVLGDVLDPSVAVSRSALATSFARESGLDSRDLFEAGTRLEKQLGRKELLERVLRELTGLSGAPTAPYQSLARLPISTVVSLFPDPVLETALISVADPYRSFVADDSMAVHELEPGRRHLFLLGGSGRFGTGLLLTRQDYQNVIDRTLYLARGLSFERRAILLIGCDLQDQRFRRLFYYISRHRTPEDGPLFVAGPPCHDDFWSKWKPIDIGLPPAELLHALDRGASSAHAMPVPSFVRARSSDARPYKYLDFYTREDADLFFGRDAAVRELTREILSAPRRVTVLCGRSGVGKTSLVQAGALPFLEREHGFRAVYTRCGADPVDSITRALAEAAQIAPGDSKKSLSEVLRRTHAKDGRPQIICIDQFEEAFIKLGPEILTHFAASLEECLSDSTGVTRFLIVIREDFLSRLAELGQTVAEIIANTYRLDDLTRDEARAAIMKPAELCGIRVEEGLADAILDDLSPTNVLPAHLQVVCDQVLAKDNGQKMLTLVAYRELGRTSGILAGHFEKALGEVPSELDAAARTVLLALVTSEKTKDILSLEQIASRTRLSPEVVSRVTHDLIHRCRLVREIRGRHDAFELSHESLVQTIEVWLDQVQKAARAAQELLDQEINTARKFGAHVIGNDRLHLIEMHRSSLAVTPEAVSLIVASYAARGEEPTSWKAETETLSAADLKEARVYRPLRHNPLLLSELVTRAGALPEAFPADIEEHIKDWIRTADVDSVLRILPELGPSQPKFGSALLKRCEGLPREQVTELVAHTRHLADTWISVAIEDSFFLSPAVPIVIVALLSSECGAPGRHAENRLLSVLKELMHSSVPEERAAACIEAALWIVREPGVDKHFTAESDIVLAAVYTNALSENRDLSDAAIDYLFARRAIDYVTPLLREMVPDHRAMLERNVLGNGDFGWRSLAVAVKGLPVNGDLIRFACRCLAHQEQYADDLRQPLEEALCQVVPSLSGGALREVAECIALGEAELSEAFATRLPSLNRFDALYILSLPWANWWQVAFHVRTQCQHAAVEKEVCSRITSAAVQEMPASAMVALLSTGDVLAHKILAALARGPIDRPQSDRHDIRLALQTLDTATRVERVILELCRVMLEESAQGVRALAQALNDLLLSDTILPLSSQVTDHTDSLLILKAARICLLEHPHALPKDVGAPSAWLQSLSYLRGRSSEIDHELGRLRASDDVEAIRSLLTGSADEQAAVLDAVAHHHIALDSKLHSALRRVGAKAELVVRAKAAALLMKIEDDQGLTYATEILQSKRIDAQSRAVIRSQLRDYLKCVSTIRLHSLLAEKAIRDVVLTEVIEESRNMLGDASVLEWVLLVLDELTWDEASRIRDQLAARLAPSETLRRLVQRGNSKQKYQARQLLLRVPSAESPAKGE